MNKQQPLQCKENARCVVRKGEADGSSSSPPPSNSWPIASPALIAPDGLKTFRLSLQVDAQCESCSATCSATSAFICLHQPWPIHMAPLPSLTSGDHLWYKLSHRFLLKSCESINAQVSYRKLWSPDASSARQLRQELPHSLWSMLSHHFTLKLIEREEQLVSYRKFGSPNASSAFASLDKPLIPVRSRLSHHFSSKSC